MIRTPRRLAGIALAGLLVLIFCPLVQAGQALVYNASGEDLRLAVNGRTSLLPWRQPSQVFAADEQGRLHLEMANVDGELLTADLEPDKAYVILYRQSKKSFAVWGTDQLKEALNELLNDLPANSKAAVFNSTGQPVVFKFRKFTQGIGRENCVFLPHADSPSDLGFQFLQPELPPVSEVPLNSLHVVSVDQETYSFQSFDQWTAGLTSRLQGQTPAPPGGPGRSDQVREEPAGDKAPAAEESNLPPVLQEDLKDG